MLATTTTNINAEDKALLKEFQNIYTEEDLVGNWKIEQ